MSSSAWLTFETPAMTFEGGTMREEGKLAWCSPAPLRWITSRLPDEERCWMSGKWIQQALGEGAKRPPHWLLMLGLCCSIRTRPAGRRDAWGGLGKNQ